MKKKQCFTPVVLSEAMNCGKTFLSYRMTILFLAKFFFSKHKNIVWCRTNYTKPHKISFKTWNRC